MNRTVHTVLGALLAATLGLVAPAAATAAPHRDIDPGALPVGAKPGLPYLVEKAEKIHVPGAAPSRPGRSAPTGTTTPGSSGTPAAAGCCPRRSRTTADGTSAPPSPS
ncbi:hypothetical protein [Nocardioides hankookensis]|uniref:Uncharacterized protein n=1 Tax=Nocardioides hankookensis TaxID=443157 RepID=A0ABW1LC84_9ACTN